MFLTYQTKLKNETIVLPNNGSIPVYEYFHQFAQRFGVLERKLFVDLYVHKKPSNELKKAYCANYQITSRQYNSIKKQLDGRVSSKQKLNALYIEEVKAKVGQTEAVLTKKLKQKENNHKALLKMKGNESNFFKKVKSYRKLRTYIHQKKRKLHSLQLRLQKLEKDEATKTIRLCFGSKELFHKQFYLGENKLTFKEWKSEWQEARAAQFTFIGSKDETYGNQTCTYNLDNQLRIRVDKKDEDVFGKHLIISNVVFPYGQENINAAKVPIIGYTKGKKNQVRYYRALTCKFIRKNHQWYINITVDVDMPKIKTLQNNGCIGVDFNANFLAVTEVDRFGNYLHSFQVPFRAYHVSSEQAEQNLSHALKTVLQYAWEKQKPIAYEQLDFKKKKQQLKQMSKTQAAMLSGFAYSSYQTMVVSKCQKTGIELKKVNPAYTSQIGQHKFMKKYGLSSHESAAMVIARRALECKRIEKLPVTHLVAGNQTILLKKRIDQWKELTKQWRKYTFGQKNLLLYKTFR